MIVSEQRRPDIQPPHDQDWEAEVAALRLKVAAIESLWYAQQASANDVQLNLTVNINTAGENDLTKLPGIGPALAKRIIRYRNDTGKFSSVEELVNVKGIGSKKLEMVRPYLSLD